MLDLVPMLTELTSGIVSEPNLSAGIGLPAARKVMLQHALHTLHMLFTLRMLRPLHARKVMLRHALHTLHMLYTLRMLRPLHARKVVLRHALDLHANLVEADAFRRPATDMLIDADACIEAAHNVVDLMQAEQANGVPPPSPGGSSTAVSPLANPSQGRRNSVDLGRRNPQVLARMLESNRYIRYIRYVRYIRYIR